MSFAVGDGGKGFERELEGVVVQRAQRVDRFVTKELMNNLFNSKKLSKLNKVNLQGEIESMYVLAYKVVFDGTFL